jgi:hypothetical protein
MHLLVISHKQSSVHGQESFKSFIRSFRSDLCPPIRGPVVLPFQYCRALSGVKMPPYHCILLSASFANLFSFVQEGEPEECGGGSYKYHHCQRPWHWCLVFLYQGAGPEGRGMNPGYQRTVAFVLILVTREALSLTAFGDGDYYAEVRGGESPYKLSCYEQDSVFWSWLYFQHVFRVHRINYATLAAPSSHFSGSIKPNLEILAI